MKRLLAAAAAVLLIAVGSASAKQMTIGVSMALFDDNFLTNLREAMAEHAKSVPDLQIQFQDAQGDIGRQLSQL
jgi:inositol transport system substrate-binding protein